MMAPKWQQDLLAGSAGFVDEMLFGIPEFVAKKIDRQAVENWIKQNEPAYRTGETVGTVGSMFVPIPGLGAVGAAKGAKAAAGVAKAAKGADVLTDLGRLAKRGLVEGAVESGVRGVTSEKSAADIAKDVQTGALFGAGGGVAGGLISKGLKKAGAAAGDLAGEASKLREQFNIGSVGIGRKFTNRLLKEAAGPGAKGLGKFQVADDVRRGLDEIISSENLQKMGADERYLKKKVAPFWEKLNDAFEKQHGKIKGSEILDDVLAKADDELLEVLTGPDSAIALEELAQVKKELGNRQGIHSIKKYLQQKVNNTYKEVGKYAEDEIRADAARDVFNSIRKRIDDMAIKAGEAQGMNPAEIALRKKRYIYDRVLGDAIAQDITGGKTWSPGSPTMEKLGAQFALAGAGAGAGAMTGETPQERLTRAAIGLGVTTGAGIAGKAASQAGATALTRAIAKGKPVTEAFEKLAPKVATVAEKITPQLGAQVGGRAASAIARDAAEAAQPSTPAQAEAAQAGAETGAEEQGTPAYVERVLDGLARYAASKGVSTESPEYSQFVQLVYQATGGFKPEAIGGILYQDPEERAAYTRALGVARQLKEIAPTAIAKGPGFLQQEAPEIGIQRKAAVDQLSALVGDVAKATGTEKAARAELNKILKRNVAPEQKEALIKTLLAAYGVDVDELYSMGVV